jgi:ABC-type lipoprotein release transport system permease subunit
VSRLGYAAVSRLLAHLVFEIEPLDPVSLIVAPMALLVVALIACLLPARRATTIDPAITLRNE